MNYLHHFHAGNFADVMKHLLLIALLDKMGQKEKPYCYIDTHAGAGLYNLADAKAQRSGEFVDGIHRLVHLNHALIRTAPTHVQTYLAQLNTLRERDGKGWYGGSIWWALQSLRDIDRAVAFEMNPPVFDTLSTYVRDSRLGSHLRDAYEGLLAVIPPKEKRGVVLIDPPYEIERKDFPQLVELLTQVHAKWSTGVFVLWYPIKDREMINRFEKKMSKTGIRRQLICELCVWPDDMPTGLNGCGLLIINPPWQFSDQADSILQWLLPHLRMKPETGHATVRWLVGE